jgi:hypothetical protein
MMMMLLLLRTLLKRSTLLAVTTAVTWAVVPPISVGAYRLVPLAHLTGAAQVAYTLTALTAPGFRVAAPLAENNAGVVVGRLTRPSVVEGFAYIGGRVRPLGEPPGWPESEAAGISGTDLVLVDAWRAHAGTEALFIRRLTGGPHVWRKLGMGALGGSIQSVGSMASNGIVAATITTGTVVKHGRLTGAVWLPGRDSSYGSAMRLPFGPPYRASTVDAIWSGGARVIVAGCVITGNSPVCPALWTRIGTGHFVGDFSADAGPVNAIGGWGRHVFIAGATGGYDYSGGWATRLTLGQRQSAALGRDLPLQGPYFAHSLFWGLTSVSAGAHGRFVAVGSAGGDTPSIDGLLWHGAHIENLRNALPVGTTWRPEHPVAINLHGQITGYGHLNGRPAGFILRPSQ